MSRVLIVCADRVGNAMAGPAIRSWEMARLLVANGNEVHLAAPELGDRDPGTFEIVVSTPRAITTEAQWADVIVVQGVVLATFPTLRMAGKRLVVDLYDPVNLEILELFHDHPLDERLQQHKGHLGALLLQIHYGDFFLCATERQRDYWLGMLSAAGRVNPHTHGSDRLLRELIDIAPFGTATEAPVHSGRPAARGVLPSIGEHDKLAVWGGGVYNWFDPLSLLKAWPAVVERVPNARLLFLGMQHPNPDVPAMAMAASALKLSEDLGLRDKSVHFNLGWVPYDQRKDFLLEADIGVSTHFDHLETAFSFRTRILDYIWAGLPVVSTDGDEFAGWIKENGTGRVVGYEDPVSIADAISGLLGDDQSLEGAAAAVRRCRPEFTWEVALAPLVRYCAEPWPARDFVAGGRSSLDSRVTDEALGSMIAPKEFLPRVRFFIEAEGLGSLVRRSVRSLRRRFGRWVAGDRY